MDGIININKQKDFTSHDVVAVVRKIIKQKKVGHAGTLDPNAQGVLPVLVGRATRFSDFVADGDKQYRAEIIFGAKTTTGDATGEVLKTSSGNVSRIELEKAVTSFLGEQQQIPPMYSAIKINGQKLYDLARQGVEVVREPRKIFIQKIELLQFSDNSALIDVVCSKGTYIRTLCEDIGSYLGVCAHMGDLWRTRVAGFKIEDSITLDDLKAAAEETDSYLISVEKLFDHLPKIYIDESSTKQLYNGNGLSVSSISKQVGEIADTCMVYDSVGNFVGLYNYGNTLKVLKMYRTGI